MSDDEWVSVERRKKKKPKPSKISKPLEQNFQRNRPSDSVNCGEGHDNDSDDERENVDIQENPIFWNKFALIGDVTKKVDKILMCHQIFPKSRIMSLSDCIKSLDKNIETSDLDNDFENIIQLVRRTSIFVSVIPRFTSREYGCGSTLYFIHIRFDWYFMADSTSRSYDLIFLQNFKTYPSFLGEKHTHIPISSEHVDAKENRKNFQDVVQIVKGKRECETFQPEYDSSEDKCSFEKNKHINSTKDPYYPSISENDIKQQGEGYICKLYLTDAHSGYGEILEGGERGKKIFLHNRRNCSRAFNGDHVEIMKFKNKFNQTKMQKDYIENSSGRVISVISSDVKPVNKIFLCHLIFGTATLMEPICKTIPVIYVDNDEARKQVKEHHANLRGGLKNVIGIDNIIQNNINILYAESFANKSFVTVKELKSDLTTIVNKIYYVDCYNCDFIFLVLYRYWDDRFRFPNGEVVGLCTPDFKFENTLNLIKVYCNMHVVGIDEEKPLQGDIANLKRTRKMKLLAEKSRKVKDQKAEDEDKIIFSLKYPNQAYNEIAFSYERKCNEKFTIGVHVVRVLDFIKEDNFIDRFARDRYFTFLLPNIEMAQNGNMQPDYLLSTSATTEFLSINRESEVDVLSFYFVINNENQIISSPEVVLNERIILNMELDVNNTDNFIGQEIPQFEFLDRIYEFCHSQRCERKHNVIPTHYFFPNYKIKINLTSLIIDEELQHLVNETASIYFENDRIIQLDDWYRQVISNNLLNDLSNDLSRTNNLRICPLIVHVIRKLNSTYTHGKSKLRLRKQFLEKLDNDLTINLFKCESLLPDVGIHHNTWKSLTGTDILNPYIFGQPILSRVTKPLSCYLDIISQRLLMLPNDLNTRQFCSERDYKEYEQFKKLFENYSKICKAYEIKHEFHDESFILDCTFESLTQDKINYHHSFLDDVNYKNFILFQSLSLSKEPYSNVNEYMEFQWKTRIFIYGFENVTDFKSNFINLKDVYSFYVDMWRKTIYSRPLDEDDAYQINRLLNDEKYPDRLTSEIIETIDPMITLKYEIKNDGHQLTRIQFTYDFSSGIMQILPELLIINPDFRLCLCHRDDPFKYFMHPDELSHINYRRFHSIHEYKTQFIILNRIEAIHQTIKCESSFTIHDLKVDWLAMKHIKNQTQHSDDDNIYGIIILKEKWCQSRFIHLVHRKTQIRDPVNALHEAVRKNNMEYLLCIQSYIEKKKIYWIGHCRVADICLINQNGEISTKKTKKRREPLDIHVTLKLVHSSFPFEPGENQLYSIEFMETPISSRIFEKSLKSLNSNEPSLSEKLIMAKNLFENPTRNSAYNTRFEDIQMKMVCKSALNEAQTRALEKSKNYWFSMIWGPPGTGKTFVGIMIAYQYVLFNRHSPKQEDNEKSKPCVLYCGPSNQSVDVVAEKLMETFGNNCPKLLRIFNSEIMNTDFPYAGALNKRESRGCPEALKPIALHYIVRKPEHQYFHELNKYSEQLESSLSTTRDVMERDEFTQIVKKYKNSLKKAFEKEIKEGNYEIILCTAAGSAKKLLQPLNIAQVILDESGMCSEPEAIGPLVNKPDLLNVVLIGDHKQLRPIVTNQIAKGKQLHISLFERIYKPQKSFCTMLDTQYRMHPSICEFPSSFFYNNENMSLKTAKCESWTGIPDNKVRQQNTFNGLQYGKLYNGYKNDLIKNNVNIADDIWMRGGIRTRDFKCFSMSIDHGVSEKVYEKILFINVVGPEVNQEISCSTGSSQSKSNPAEAKVVESLYTKLIGKMQNKTNACQSILVITQYRSQENNLRNICQGVLESYDVSGQPRVCTVVKSQGSESDYVIFSTVRSLPSKDDIDRNPTPGWIKKYLGFITDENQVNVALTRAKKGLFIIGNSNLLSIDKMWNDIIEDLKNRKCFIDNYLHIY